jgi:hypothetical protein
MYLLPATILAISLPDELALPLFGDYFSHNALETAQSLWGVTPPKPPMVKHYHARTKWSVNAVP